MKAKKIKREFLGKLQGPYGDEKSKPEQKIYEKNWHKKALKAYIRGWEYFDFGYDKSVSGLSIDKIYFRTPQRITVLDEE
jgi:hypothetical protein